MARHFFYNRVLRSLLHLKLVAERELPQYSFTLESLLVKPINAHALDPEIFFLHDQLLKGMRSQNLDSVQHTLSDLKQYVSMLETSCARTLDTEILSLQNTSWEDFVISESRRNIEIDLGRVPEINPVSEDIASENTANINAAIKEIQTHFPEMFDEIRIFLNKIRIFDGCYAMGITDVRMYGCLFIRVPRDNVDPILYYGEHICHEVSHMYLNAAMSLDPMVLNNRNECYKSPLRPDHRPMIGVFHATFVISRVVQFFCSLVMSTDNTEAKVYLEQQLDELKSGIEEVQQYGKITKVGEHLVKEFNRVYDMALSQPFWRSYDFERTKEHRFGGGAKFQANHPLKHATQTAVP